MWHALHMQEHQMYGNLRYSEKQQTSSKAQSQHRDRLLLEQRVSTVTW